MLVVDDFGMEQSQGQLEYESSFVRSRSYMEGPRHLICRMSLQGFESACQESVLPTPYSSQSLPARATTAKGLSNYDASLFESIYKSLQRPDHDSSTE